MTGTRALAFLMVLVGMSSRADAEPAKAKALFDEGKTLLEAGEVKKACAKFEASQELDPRDATEMNLALCWEQLGRTASAWEMFVKLSGTSKREDRAAAARKRAKDLEPKLVHLTIEIESDLEDLVISRNDQVVDRAQWNRPVAVDPAEYTITVKAPEHEAWSKTITIKTKDKTIEVPKLERTRAEKKPTPVRDTPNPYRGAALGLLIGGGGAVAIASGVAFHSRSVQNDSRVLCPNPTCSDQRGINLNARARQEGWIANVTWGLGGAAVIAAVVVWRVGAKKQDRAVAITPVVDRQHAGVALGGRF